MIYTDGSKNDTGVASGVAVFMANKLTQELRFKLDSKYTNNQVEQFAILKAVETMKQHKIMEDRQKTHRQSNNPRFHNEPK